MTTVEHLHLIINERVGKIYTHFNLYITIKQILLFMPIKGTFILKFTGGAPKLPKFQAMKAHSRNSSSSYFCFLLSVHRPKLSLLHRNNAFEQENISLAAYATEFVLPVTSNIVCNL